jgi:thiamine kinase-like enzyme
MNHHVKHFQSPQDTKEEYDGYRFFAPYYFLLPRLIGTDFTDQKLTYEAVDHNSKMIATALDNHELVEVKENFKALAALANKYAYERPSEGGTHKFFMNRRQRLDTAETLYQAWSAKNPRIVVQNSEVLVDPALIKNIRQQIAAFEYGICIPSQGDIHERNMFTNGTIVDFEAAGWNLLATDIATFLWHTLFAGNYFGPRYAKWATDDDRQKASLVPVIVIDANDTITVTISPERANLTRQYLDYYIDALPLDQKIVTDISAAMSMRLLTTFPVQNMSEEDRHATFGLVNYIMSTNALTTVQHLIG